MTVKFLVVAQFIGLTEDKKGPPNKFGDHKAKFQWLGFVDYFCGDANSWSPNLLG